MAASRLAQITGREKTAMDLDPAITFVIVLLIGIVAGVL